MSGSGWLQLLIFVAALVAITKPMGHYLIRVLDPYQDEGDMGFLEKVFGPIERLIYKIMRVDSEQQQNWKQYAIALLIFSLLFGRYFQIIPVLALAGAQEAGAGECGKFPRRRAHVRLAHHRSDHHRRRVEFPAGPGDGTNR